MEFSEDIRIVLKDLYPYLKFLWNLKTVEYNLIYHPENVLLSLDEKFTRFLEDQNILVPSLDINENMIHPSVYMAYLAAPRGAIVSLTSGADFHRELKEIKIFLNPFQNIEMIDNVPQIKLKNIFFNGLIDDPEKFCEYNLGRNIKRDPQLRRKLKTYFKIRKIPFDENVLREKLPIDGLYGHLDADELVLLHQFEKTYFNLLPKELKVDIINQIDISFTNIGDIEDNNLTKFMKGNLDLIYNLQNGGNLSTMLESIESSNIMKDIRGKVPSNSPAELIKYLCGSNMYDVVQTLEKQLYDETNEFSEGETEDILNEVSSIKK